MIKCGNRECKYHDNSDIYTICKHSNFYVESGKRYVNLCKNEKRTTSKDERRN